MYLLNILVSNRPLIAGNQMKFEPLTLETERSSLWYRSIRWDLSHFVRKKYDLLYLFKYLLLWWLHISPDIWRLFCFKTDLTKIKLFLTHNYCIWVSNFVPYISEHEEVSGWEVARYMVCTAPSTLCALILHPA